MNTEEVLLLKHPVIVILLLILTTMVGCQSDTEAVPKAEMFGIMVQTSRNLQANEVFSVNSSLINNSKSSWKIEHGASMFTYEAYDMNGKLVQQNVKERFVDAIGYVTTLNSKDSYSYDEGEHVSPKYNELLLQEGSYEVISKAKFRIKKDEKEFDFEIESKPFKIDVY
ncbi:hypothetical protein [Paenibacillus sp. sgz302251]|uniref:hypothetical protein n=1 Tax=Paenibacillus sp. sgz302251 TaxID=3414493 RepID=UPI003C7A7467